MGKWYKVPVGVGRRRHGPRLLVLRRERLPDGLPGAPRSRAEAAGPPVEVPRHRRRRPDRRDGPGRDPGDAGARRLALSRGPRGRVDRPDQPRAHQPRHRPDDARRRRALPARAAARRRGSVAAARERCVGAAARRLARVLRLVPLSRLPRGSLVVGHGLTPTQAMERTSVHGPLLVGSGVLVFGAFWFLLAVLVRSYRSAPRPLSLYVARGLRRARRRDAPGPDPGVPGRARAAGPRRRGGRRDRQPARAAEHARRADGAAHRRRTRAAPASDATPGRARACGNGGLLRRRESRSPSVEAAPDGPAASFGAAVRSLEPWAALVLVPGRARRARRLRRVRARRVARDGARAETGAARSPRRGPRLHRAGSPCACAG